MNILDPGKLQSSDKFFNQRSVTRSLYSSQTQGYKSSKTLSHSVNDAISYMQIYQLACINTGSPVDGTVALSEILHAKQLEDEKKTLWSVILCWLAIGE